MILMKNFGLEVFTFPYSEIDESRLKELKHMTFWAGISSIFVFPRGTHDEA